MLAIENKQHAHRPERSPEYKRTNKHLLNAGGQFQDVFYLSALSFYLKFQ